jgi:hypothetical protein
MPGQIDYFKSEHLPIKKFLHESLQDDCLECITVVKYLSNIRTGTQQLLHLEHRECLEEWSKLARE